MRIIDIMKDVAVILGLNNVYADIDAIDLDSDNIVLTEDLETLFNLCRVSIQEFCTNYAPVIDSIKISTTNKKYALNKIDNFLKLKKISLNGEDVKAKIRSRNIEVDKDGEYDVLYYTYPNIDSITDDIDFLSSFTPDVLISSACAYWSLSHGQYADFNKFHEDYLKKANAIKDLRVFNMPQRRWE